MKLRNVMIVVHNTLLCKWMPTTISKCSKQAVAKCTAKTKKKKAQQNKRKRKQQNRSHHHDHGHDHDHNLFFLVQSLTNRVVNVAKLVIRVATGVSNVVNAYLNVSPLESQISHNL